MTGTRKIPHLNRHYHFTRLMRDPSIDCHLLHYNANYDESLQTILIMRPRRKKSATIFFFFHGMDGDCGDGVVAQDLVKRLNATIISMGGRGPCWISDAFISDAEQIIHRYYGGFQDYYLIGISMGGSQALALAGLLSKKIRRTISGVIALIPGADLSAMARESSHQRVKDTLMASVRGDKYKLRQRSPINLVNYYKKNLPFVIFYNKNDTIALTKKMEKFILALQKSHPVSVFTAPGNHKFTYKNFGYQKIFEALGKNLNYFYYKGGL